MKNKSPEIFDDFTSARVTKQHRDAQRIFCAEESILAYQTSKQLNADFRVMEHDTSAEKDEFYRIQMEKFAIEAVEDD